MPIELEVKKTITVEEGRHDAIITRVAERTDPYHYIDVYFGLGDMDIALKYGCSAHISEKSKLGKLLDSLGVFLDVGTMIDLERVLIGKRVTLVTINKKSERGVFAEIVDGSIRPLS